MSERELLGAMWIDWLLFHGRGATNDGHVIRSAEDLLHVCERMAREGQRPPGESDMHRGEALLTGAQVLLDVIPSIESVPVQEQTGALLAVHDFIYALAINGAYHIAAPHVALLRSKVELHPSAPIRLQLGLTLSAIMREQEGIAHCLSFLESLRGDAQSMGKGAEANYYLSVGNCLKDLNRYDEALRAYDVARNLAESSASPILDAIVFQMGRLHLELSRNSEAQELFQQAAKKSFRGIPYAGMSILSDVSRIAAMVEKGDFSNCLRELDALLDQLPDPPAHHDEATIHHAASLIARRLHMGLAREWTCRMSVIAGELGMRTREVGATQGNLALALVRTSQGAEARYWMQRALRKVTKMQEEGNRVDTLISIGYGMYMFGLSKEGLQRYDEGFTYERGRPIADLERIRLNGQHALLARRHDPGTMRKAKEEVIELIPRLPKGEMMVIDGLGFLAACEMLSSTPTQLADWPDVLRRGKTRVGGELAPLQMILDARGEVNLPDTFPTPHARNAIRGHMHGYLCGRGFLDFIHRYTGVAIVEVMEWALGGAPQHEFVKRICLEWIINPTGTQEEQRRGKNGEKSAWVSAVPALRAVMMRYFFLHDLAEKIRENELPRELPHLPTEADLDAARGALLSAYRRWRSEKVIDAADVEDFQKNFRKRSSTKVMPNVEEMNAKLISDPGSEHVRRKIMNFVERYGQSVSHENLKQANEVFNREIAPLIGLPTTEELGIRLDNFLETELVDPLRAILKATGGNAPVLLDLFQAEDAVYWLVVRPDNGEMLRWVTIHRVPISRQEAESICGDIRFVMRPPRKGRVSIGSELSRIYAQSPELFRPILGLIEGREVLLNMMPPWSLVPLEQMPIDRTGLSLVDWCEVRRRDPFHRWLVARSGARAQQITQITALVLGDSLGDDPTLPEEAHLPSARKEAEEVARLLGVQALTGMRCSIKAFEQAAPGKRVIHIACHGYHLHELGDYPVLALADGYLLGQELAAMDLATCELVVVSACHSAAGDAFGTAPVESIGGYLLEAGARTVVATTASVSDELTADVMLDFYHALLEGHSVCVAARHAFGAAQRMQRNVPLFSWVVMGNGEPIFQTR